MYGTIIEHLNLFWWLIQIVHPHFGETIEASIFIEGLSLELWPALNYSKQSNSKLSPAGMDWFDYPTPGMKMRCSYVPDSNSIPKWQRPITSVDYYGQPKHSEGGLRRLGPQSLFGTVHMWGECRFSEHTNVQRTLMSLANCCQKARSLITANFLTSRTANSRTLATCPWFYCWFTVNWDLGWFSSEIMLSMFWKALQSPVTCHSVCLFRHAKS